MPKFTTVFECKGTKGSAKVQTQTNQKYWILQRKEASTPDAHATWEQVSECYHLGLAITRAVELSTDD